MYLECVFISERDKVIGYFFKKFQRRTRTLRNNFSRLRLVTPSLEDATKKRLELSGTSRAVHLRNVRPHLTHTSIQLGAVKSLDNISVQLLAALGHEAVERVNTDPFGQEVRLDVDGLDVGRAVELGVKGSQKVPVLSKSLLPVVGLSGVDRPPAAVPAQGHSFAGLVNFPQESNLGVDITAFDLPDGGKSLDTERQGNVRVEVVSRSVDRALNADAASGRLCHAGVNIVDLDLSINVQSVVPDQVPDRVVFELVQVVGLPFAVDVDFDRDSLAGLRHAAGEA